MRLVYALFGPVSRHSFDVDDAIICGEDWRLIHIQQGDGHRCWGGTDHACGVRRRDHDREFLSRLDHFRSPVGLR